MPVVLAALLVGQRSPYFAAALTIIAIIGALMLNPLYPPPPLVAALPPDLSISLGLGAVALFLLALTLAPLRGEVARLFWQVQQDEQARKQADQHYVEVDRAREEALAQVAWQQRHVDLLLQQIGDGAIAVDAAGQVARANAAARNLWSAVVGGNIMEARSSRCAWR